uniref:Uncharacterized protein n=1 Tax=Strongyloides stercoralis TaxID=6248 RepID=A0AAF5DF94_STRER
WKMLWKELEAVALLKLNRKHVNFFLGGIRLELVLVTIVKPDIICCCFGDCCSTVTDSEALRFFWKKLEDVLILQLSRKHRKAFLSWVGSCCSTGAKSGACKLF